MAFEDVNILVRVGTTPTTVRWRQDGAAGSLVTFSLSDNRDVRTFDWQLIGRPEGTGAAGGGPEPISLGTGQSCAITLDIQGTYIVACVINGGSPTQTIKTAGVAIICEITDPLGRPLRYLGGYETDEDLADPLVEQGWMKMLDRWLHALEHYIRGGGADTFKVALDNADVLAATYGFLPDKLTSPNASIDINPRVAGATPKVGLDVAKDARAPLGPVPGGDPGDGPKAAMWDHQHPPEGASASTLYTGVIRAATLLDPVKSFVAVLGGWTPGGGQADLWDVLPSGDYRHKAVGQLYGLDPTGTSSFVLSVGDRVYLWNWQPSGAGSDPTVFGGLCTVITLGDASTKAVLRKTSDTIQDGSTFRVTGSGAQYENWYWEIDPDPTNLYPLTYKPDYVSATTFNLFTGAQLALSAPGTHETSVAIPGGTSGGTLFEIPSYVTLAGTPGVTKILKGEVIWEVLAYLVADDPAAITYIEAFLSTAGGVDHNFAFGYSRPIHATEPTVFTFQATIPEDIDCNLADLLSATFYGFSNSLTGVTIKLVYNEPKHRTRVTVPMEFPLQGYDTYKVKLTDANDPNPDFVDKKAVEGDHISLEVVEVGGVRKLKIGCTLAPDDHQVGASAADIAAGKWGPLVSKARGDNITVTSRIETDPVLGEQVVFSAVPAAPGSDGAWLYTARVPDSKLRDPVRCLLQSNFRPLLLQPVKCLVADQGSWSTVYNPVARTLLHSTVGEIFGLDSSHGNTLSLDVGDRVWFRGEYTQWSQDWSGLYTVSVKGSATEQAVLIATPFDAFSVGKCFEVNGAGAYATGLWTCVQVSPELSFSLGEPLPAAIDGCGFGTWWQQIAGTNLWQAPVAGPIYGQDQFADPSILLATGNRVLTYDSDHIADEGQYYGPYEVLDPGFYYPPGAAPVFTRAIIRRVLDADSSDELCNGMTVRVTPGEVAYSGNYFTISTADPIEVDVTVLAWSTSGSYTDGGADRLLTLSQLGLASATTAEVATEIPAGQIMEMLVPLKPVTLDGTPGASEFPAGPVTYEIACRVSSDDPDAEVLISAALSPSGSGTGAWIAEATSQPIRATATTVYTLRAQVSAAVPLSLSDVLYWWFWASNTGTSPVTLTIVYNDTAHSTRVQTTLALAGGGTDDHRRLTAESKGWAAGQEKWSQLFQHPEGTVCSRFPSDCSATIDAAGLLVIPDTCSGVVLVTGSTLRAIQIKDADGNLEFGNQAPIKLRFAGACKMYHADPLSGWDAGLVARVAKLDLLPPDGAEGEDLNRSAKTKNTMRFTLDTTGAAPLWILEVGQ